MRTGFGRRERARMALGLVALVGGVLMTVGPALGLTAATGRASQPSAIAATCEDSGPLTPRGDATVSGPILTALQTTPVPLSLSGSTDAPDEVLVGGEIDYQVRLQLDLQALAATVLADTIRPAVSGAAGAALANTAALNLRVVDLAARLDLPPGTTLVGVPTASTSAGGPTATVSTEPGTLIVSLDEILANAGAASSATTTTAAGTPAFDIIVGFRVATTGVAAGTDLALTPGPIAFTFDGPIATVGGFNVSVNFLGTEIAGGADGPFGCTVAAATLATTRVVDELTTSSSASTSESTTTTDGPTTTTGGPTTTTGGPTTTTGGPTTTTGGPTTSSPTTDPTTSSTEAPTTTAMSSTTSQVPSSSTTDPTEVDDNRFENCTEAAAAGVSNIPSSSPDYRPELDGDSDGIACEATGVPGSGGGTSGGGTNGGSTTNRTNVGTTPLARTGATTVPLLVGGAGLAAVGVALLLAGRRVRGAV